MLAHALWPASGWALDDVRARVDVMSDDDVRAAVARALVGNPRVILGDEPTGNLDERTADHVYGLMLELNQELNTSLLLVTHARKLAARMDRQLELRMGCLQELE